MNKKLIVSYISALVVGTSSTAAAELDAGKVRAQCSAVIRAIPMCDKYVNDVDAVIHGCVGDTLLTGDVNNIERSKQAYLRDCRRAMDSAVVGEDRDAKLAPKPTSASKPAPKPTSASKPAPKTKTTPAPTPPKT